MPSQLEIERFKGALGPYDLSNAPLITNSDMYVGRLIKKRDTGQATRDELQAVIRAWCSAH